MRVRNTPDIVSLVRLGQMVRIDGFVGNDEDDSGESFAEFLEAPSIPEDINELVASDIFNCLAPGIERTCLVLLAEGYTYQSIQSITGLTDHKIRAAVATARVKVKQYGDKSAWQQGIAATPHRVWHVPTQTLSFSLHPETLSPKKHYRIMRPTMMHDAAERLVYEWDILERDKRIITCSFWRNTRSSGFSITPDWASQASIIGNIYQHPLLAARARREHMA